MTQPQSDAEEVASDPIREAAQQAAAKLPPMTPEQMRRIAELLTAPVQHTQRHKPDGV